MEISGSDFAYITGVSRQTIYALWKKGKLVKSQAKKFEIYEPPNLSYLKQHGRSALDVEEYLSLGRKPFTKRSLYPDKINPKEENLSHCRPSPPKNAAPVNNEPDQSEILLKCVDIVISKKYSSDEAIKIKNMIFEEMGKYV
jgi:hypothetical protein